MIHEMSSIVYSLVLVFTESSGLVFCYSAVECILIIIASLFVFMLVNVFNEQITTFENIPPIRREVVFH